MSDATLAHFQRPYDWNAIDRSVAETGGVILEDLLDQATLDGLNREIDAYLEGNENEAAPHSGSPGYDHFLGHKTLRLHGLAVKMPQTRPWLAHPDLVGWAERSLDPVASGVLLNAGELIQIQPGEPAQMLHRDSDSWPTPLGEHPVVVNALLALDHCTLENGATWIAPGSHAWDRLRQPKKDEFVRAVMDAGDAVLFRGDAIHRGGENATNTRRRVISISYCAGWLRPVENSFLNVPRDVARSLPAPLQAVLGYTTHDGTGRLGGMLGLYENGDPAGALTGDEARQRARRSLPG